MWAGEGKSLGKIIARTDVGFAARYESAFSEAFGGSYERLSGLVNEILAPCGGRLFEGYLRRAPGA